MKRLIKYKRLIKAFSKKAFSSEQENFLNEYSSDIDKSRIEYGFENGLSINQIKVYIDEEGLNQNQITEIVRGFKGNLSMEQVKFYAKKEYNWAKMRFFRRLLKYGVIESQILEYFNKDFNGLQMLEIVNGFDDGLDLYKVLLYADTKFDDNQMSQIRIGLNDPDLTLDDVKLYINADFDHFQMSQIKLGLKSLTREQVEIYVKPEYDYEMMNTIRASCKDLSPEQLDFYLECLDNGFDNEQLEAIKLGFYFNRLTINQVKLYANKNYSGDLMRIIGECIADNLPKEIIDFLIKFLSENDFDLSQMYIIYHGFEAGLNINQVKFYADIDLSDFEMKDIKDKLVKLKLDGKLDNLSNNEIDQIFNPDFTSEQKKDILKCFELNIPAKEILKFVNGDLSSEEMIYNYFNNSDNFKDEEDNFENDE